MMYIDLGGVALFTVTVLLPSGATSLNKKVDVITDVHATISLLIKPLLLLQFLPINQTFLLLETLLKIFQKALEGLNIANLIGKIV